MTYKEAAKVFLQKYRGLEVVSIMEVPSAFIICAGLKNSDAELIGCLYKVNKSTGKASEYAFNANLPEFRAAQKHIVYRKGDHLSHDGVKGMRWGLRRYQNPDGTLTELGKQRLKAKRDAEMLKNPDKYDTQDKITNLEKRLTDPNAWVLSDMKRSRNALDAGDKLVKNMQDIERNTRPEPKQKKRMDLSSMTDQELRERINRELMEKQYNDLFNKPDPVKVSKGRERVQNILTTAGVTIGVASSAVGLALAIKQLKEDRD